MPTQNSTRRTVVNGSDKKKSSKTGKKNYDDLIIIYKEKGPRSNEFFFYVQNLIVKILNKYIRYYDEDLVIDCYVRILELIDERYSPEKGNLGNFVYTIVRNCSSKYLYHKTKQYGEILINEELNKVKYKNVEVATNKSLATYHTCNNFKKLRLSKDLKEYMRKCAEDSESNCVFSKVVKWENMKSL